MDLSNLMMLWNFLLAFYIVYADVIREDGYHNYEGQFTVKNKGRMLRVLMSFRNVEMEECALHCVRHLRCRTFNYHHGRRDCELTDEEFNKMDVDTFNHGWCNYGTPKRVNGGWSSWRNYTECTETCGDGTLEQYRDCDSPRPEHGGAECKGKMTRRVKCNIRGCPVNGGWSSWMDYTPCTETCGSGKLEQRRECDSPSPEYGGANCTGDKQKTVDCNTHNCPVNGKWSKWKNSTTCSKTCGKGTVDQYRDCDSPKPEHGGAQCTGIRNRTVECNTRECEVVNIALRKTATQSSTKDSSVGAKNAVDGNPGYFSCTEAQSNPWWEVDMGAVKVIKNVHLNAVVHSRSNNGLVVETRKSKVVPWTVCKDIGDVKQKITKINCIQQAISARFLRIRSTKKCSLMIYEVEIFGY